VTKSASAATPSPRTTDNHWNISHNQSNKSAIVNKPVSKTLSAQSEKSVSVTHKRPKGLRPTRSQTTGQTAVSTVTVHYDSSDKDNSVSKSLLKKSDSINDSGKETSMLSMSTLGHLTAKEGPSKLNETSQSILKVWLYFIVNTMFLHHLY
jgi:hypothetical protein